ncbi:MAG: ABC transporter permease subunit [Desulfobacterales bacterium]|nr:MAG: ABC transporter permease subunit [Desulfobacterales bacterium]
MSLVNSFKESSLNYFSKVFGRGPVKPGESYGAPGIGNSTAISVVTSVTLIFLWWFVTNMGWIKPLFLPTPESVLKKFVSVWSEDFGGSTLWGHSKASLFRVFTAFFLACVTAIPVGIGMGVNRVFRGVFDPPIEFYRPIPPLGYLPLTIIWLGIEDLQKITLIYLAIFAPMALNARSGVRSVTIEQIQMAYSLGATRAQVIWHVILKGAMPEILTGMRIGIGFGWTTLVAAEMVAAEAGIGHMVLSAAEFLVTDVVIMGIFVIGGIAYMFDLLMRFIERKIVPWKGKM